MYNRQTSDKFCNVSFFSMCLFYLVCTLYSCGGCVCMVCVWYGTCSCRYSETRCPLLSLSAGYFSHFWDCLFIFFSLIVWKLSSVFRFNNYSDSSYSLLSSSNIFHVLCSQVQIFFLEIISVFSYIFAILFYFWFFVTGFLCETLLDVLELTL